MKVDMKEKLGILLSFSIVTTFASKDEQNTTLKPPHVKRFFKVITWKCSSGVFLMICPPSVVLMAGTMLEATISQNELSIFLIIYRYKVLFITEDLCYVSELQGKTFYSRAHFKEWSPSCFLNDKIN